MRFAAALLVLGACAPSGTPSGRFETPYALNLSAFLSPPPAPGSAFIVDVATAEFDGDGLSDLVVAWGGGFVTVARFADSSLGVPERLDGDHTAPLLTFGSTLLTTSTTHRLQLSRWNEERPGMAQVGWVDAGHPPTAVLAIGTDIIASSDAGLQVFASNGVTFGPSTQRPLSARGSQLATADVDADGLPDLLVFQRDVGRTQLFRGTPSGLTDAASFETPALAGSIAVGPVGDAVELLVTSEDGPIRRNVWRDGRFEPSGEIPLTACTQALLTDVDGDASNDLIALCGGVIEVLRYVDGAFESLNRLPVDGARLVRRGDVTGDGLADLLIVPRSGAGTLFVARAHAFP